MCLFEQAGSAMRAPPAICGDSTSELSNRLLARLRGGPKQTSSVTRLAVPLHLSVSASQRESFSSSHGNACSQPELVTSEPCSSKLLNIAAA